MKRTFTLILFAAVVVCSFSSCSFVKRMLNTDLEDEDFIISQLYQDELVKETPYRPKNTNTASIGKTKTKSASLAALRTSSSDAALYDAIDPWMGVPYKYGGTTKSGVDCSGFVGAVYKAAYGITLHRVARDMQQDVTFVSRGDLQEGDILFFVNSKGNVSHVGIYLRDETFVHSSTSNGVSLSQLNSTYWSQHFYKAGRVNRK